MQSFEAASNARLAAQQEGTDPTRTKTLRSRFAAHAYRLLRELKGDIRTVVVDDDAFGLTTPDEPQPTLLADRPGSISQNAHFDFPTDEEKIAAFLEWLREQEEAGILEAHDIPLAGRSGRTSAWADTYLRPAYQKGVEHADTAVTAAGYTVTAVEADQIFRARKHADAAALIFTRAYRELQGVTDAMDQQMSRTLATGLVQGQNPRVLATELNKAVGMGMDRARLIAQTETIRAHNEAALHRYDELGVERVEGQVELLTAGDNRVCDQCASLEGETFSIKDAHGVIPLHPSCRCSWLPVL